MNLYEPQNLFNLWLESFKVTYRTFLREILLATIVLLPAAVLAGLIYTMGMISPMAIVIFLIPFFLYSAFLYLVVPLALFRLIDSYVGKNQETIFDCIFHAIVPVFYYLGYCIVVGVCQYILGRALHFASLSTTVIFLIKVVLFFAVWLRLIFAVMAIATREMGPIEALVYSWRLTSGKNYLKVVGAAFMYLVLPILAIAAMAVVIYALYVGIPLLAPNLDISAMPNALFLLIVVLFFIYCGLIGWFCEVFPFMVFFNMDACFMNQEVIKPGQILTEQPQQLQQQPQQQRPLPQRPLPQQPLPQQPLPQQPWGNKTGIVDDGEDVNIYTVPGAPREEPEMEDLTVEKAEVKTEGHADNLQDHLEQVYTPEDHQDLVQYGDEDRMPTILFDDTLAKQLEEHRKMMMPENEDSSKKDSDNEGPTSIKMSK